MRSAHYACLPTCRAYPYSARRAPSVPVACRATSPLDTPARQGPPRGGMGKVPQHAGDGDSAMATKRKQSDAEKLLAAQFAELEPDRRILTSADREYIRGLLRRGLSPEQIVPVFTAAKYQELDVRAVIEASAHITEAADPGKRSRNSDSLHPRATTITTSIFCPLPVAVAADSDCCQQILRIMRMPGREPPHRHCVSHHPGRFRSRQRSRNFRTGATRYSSRRRHRRYSCTSVPRRAPREERMPVSRTLTCPCMGRTMGIPRD